MVRNQFVFALSILTLCLFQPVLAQTAPEENKIESKVPLRNFEGAWSETQVREWVNGPLKEWLDKAGLFFSMIKPENWTPSGATGERAVQSSRTGFESTQRLFLAGLTNRHILLSQPYDLTATIGVYWSIESVGEEFVALSTLDKMAGVTGGPSPELAVELIDHTVEGNNLLTESTIYSPFLHHPAQKPSVRPRR